MDNQALHNIIRDNGPHGLSIGDGVHQVRITLTYEATDNADEDHSDYHAYKVVTAPGGFTPSWAFKGKSNLGENLALAIATLDE